MSMSSGSKSFGRRQPQRDSLDIDFSTHSPDRSLASIASSVSSITYSSSKGIEKRNCSNYDYGWIKNWNRYIIRILVIFTLWNVWIMLTIKPKVLSPKSDMPKSGAIMNKMDFISDSASITHSTSYSSEDSKDDIYPNKVKISSALRESKAIPLPLPTDKVSVVMMNYSRPRMIRESSLMRTLLEHPNVGEVVLLHSNPKTLFEYVHDKVKNIDATEENDEMGLSLRFYFCQMVKYDWVIQVDDDMEFDPSVISDLLIEFHKNTKRIVGRFGRNIKPGNFFNGYSSKSTHKQTDVVLTKIMVMERDLCSMFFEYAHLIWGDIVLNEGEGPLWNGEDIFMSLVANHLYGEKNNYAMDWLHVRKAPQHFKDYSYGKLDISGGYHGFRFWRWEWWQSLFRRNRHYSYRGKLWQVAKSRLASIGGREDGIMTLKEMDALKI